MVARGGGGDLLVACSGGWAEAVAVGLVGVLHTVVLCLPNGCGLHHICASLLVKCFGVTALAGEVVWMRMRSCACMCCVQRLSDMLPLLSADGRAG
jgi:hypothetical protein